jgi:glycosyltransferase involved in cell wall biosynthesis
MSDGMRDVLRPKYPQTNFVPLIHTFEKICNPIDRDVAISGTFDIAFMGSLNDSNREAFSRVAAVLVAKPDSRFTTYSGNRDEDFAAIGIAGPHVSYRRVSFDEVVDALRQHNILFFPHGFSGGLNPIEYETIFPTRTTPYLLSGIPIIAHSPPNAFLTRWLRQRDCAEIVDDPSPVALVRAFERLAEDPERCRELSKNAQRAASEFYAPVVAQFFRDQIENLRINQI